MEKINVKEFVKELEPCLINRRKMIFDIVSKIDDQDFLKELLLYTKLTEKNYFMPTGHHSEYYFYFPSYIKDNMNEPNPIKNTFCPDRYYVFRQAIALNKNLSEEILKILSEDKNLYVLEVVASRNDLTIDMGKVILKTACNEPQRYNGMRENVINKLTLNKTFIFNDNINNYSELAEQTMPLYKNQAIFAKEFNLPYQKDTEPIEYNAMRNLILKDITTLTVKDVEEIYFTYVKPYRNNIDAEWLGEKSLPGRQIVDLFLNYFPHSLISENIQNDLNDWIINLKNNFVDYKQYADDVVFWAFKKFVECHIKFDYEKFIDKYFYIIAYKGENPKNTKREKFDFNFFIEGGLRGVYYREDIPKKFADICSIENIDVKIVESIWAKFKEYQYENHKNGYDADELFNLEPIFLAIVSNASIDFSQLNPDLLQEIYNFKDVSDAIATMKTKGIDAYSLVYNRKIAERIDTHLEVLKKLMLTNDPFIQLNLLENPNSDKEIIEYIYNNTEFDYNKNKAFELLHTSPKKVKKFEAKN